MKCLQRKKKSFGKPNSRRGSSFQMRRAERTTVKGKEKPWKRKVLSASGIKRMRGMERGGEQTSHSSKAHNRFRTHNTGLLTKQVCSLTGQISWSL